jgi:hypothetical protein
MNVLKPKQLEDIAFWDVMPHTVVDQYCLHLHGTLFYLED